MYDGRDMTLSEQIDFALEHSTGPVTIEGIPEKIFSEKSGFYSITDLQEFVARKAAKHGKQGVVQDHGPVIYIALGSPRPAGQRERHPRGGVGGALTGPRLSAGGTSD